MVVSVPASIIESASLCDSLCECGRSDEKVRVRSLAGNYADDDHVDDENDCHGQLWMELLGSNEARDLFFADHHNFGCVFLFSVELGLCEVETVGSAVAHKAGDQQD